MTRTRKQIEHDKRNNEDQIKELQNNRVELNKEAFLLCDKDQWFSEKEELIPHRDGRRKTQENKLIGRIHWNEDFIDESTGDIVTIERSQVIRVNGEWI